MSQLDSLYVLPRRQVISARRTGLLQGLFIGAVTCAAALLIARQPVALAEEQMAATAPAAQPAEPCREQLPMRKTITQAHIDRLCIKQQARRTGSTVGGK